MTDGQTALLRLMAWLSPAFPVGSFSYSHGLETAVHAGLVEDGATLRDWLADLVERGSAWNDAVLFAEAYRRTRSFGTVGQQDAQRHDPPLACRPSPPQGGRSTVLDVSHSTNTAEEGQVATLRISPLEGEMADRPEGGGYVRTSALVELCALGEALAGSRERHMETMNQGAAFLKAAAAWPHPVLADIPADCPYPVAVGAVSGAHGMPLTDALAAFLHAFVSNQLQVAIRLSVLGQTDAMATLVALEPLVARTATRAAVSTLDDLGSATMMAEIAAMQHETHYSRLFRT